MSGILTPATGWRSLVDPIVETTGDQLKVEIERLHPASFGWALVCCRGRRDEAEDVLQSAYLKVLNGKARFDGRSAIKTWLLAVVRTTASEQRRSRWLRHLAFARWLAGRPEPAAANDAETADLRCASSRSCDPADNRAISNLTFGRDDCWHTSSVIGRQFRSLEARAHRRDRGETARFFIHSLV